MKFQKKKRYIGMIAVVLSAAFVLPVFATSADITSEKESSVSPITDSAAQLKEYVSDTVLSDINAELKRTRSEMYIPCATDAFTKTKSLKGIQGNPEFEHYFMNSFLETGFAADGTTDGTPYEYEGKTYYFRIPDGINESLIRFLNKSGKTVSIKLLLQLEEGKRRLVDPDARSGGYKYYSPNFAEPEMAKEYEAFFHFLAEKFSRADCHIDNWILANEENMPAMGRIHPYSTYYGTRDKHIVVSKYAEYFMCVYNAVRSYTTATRVSVSVDHSWCSNDDGRGISVKAFLDEFHEIVDSDVMWYIDYHAYPAVIYDTRIWAPYSPVTRTKLNPRSETAPFVDGANLYIFTKYVSQHYGSQHRIMLTEVGFSQYAGADEQAACFAFTYYAAKYSDMVDCLIIHSYNQGGKMDFSLNMPMRRVFNRIDKDDPKDKRFIDETCLPVIGVESWREIVPGYK